MVKVFDSGGGSSSSTTDSTTDTTTDSTTSGSSDPVWGSIAPSWLQDSDTVGVLTTFASSPQGFIIGAVISTLLGGVETIVTYALDTIELVFLGSDGVPSATGTLGFADLPVVATVLITDSGDVIADATLDAVSTGVTAAVEAAEVGGIFAPVILSAEIAVVLVVGAWLLRTLVEVLADFVPGLGGILN